MAQFEFRRTGWDVFLGVLLALVGLFLIIEAAWVTPLSVMVMGWLLLGVGVVALVASLFRIGKGGFWSAALTGAFLGVLGLFFLTNTGAAMLTLTLIAGTIFLASGVVRLAVGAQDRTYRIPLIFGGLVSTALGLIVLFNLFEATAVLLGILLGVQVLVDGITMIAVGRWHVTTAEEATAEVNTGKVEMPTQREKPTEQQRKPQPH